MLLREPTVVPIDGWTVRVAASPELLAVVSGSGVGSEARRRLTILGWSGDVRGKVDLDDGDGDPRIDLDGRVWLVVANTLRAFDGSALEQARVDVELVRSETIGAFLKLPDGFIVATGTRGRPQFPFARVLRLDEAGCVVWERNVRPRHLGFDRPGLVWNTHYVRVPLLLAVDSLLVGYSDESAGIGVRFVLNARDGELVWSAAPLPVARAAMAGPGEFLLGHQGYGQIGTQQIVGGELHQTWPTAGHYLVTSQGKRLVEQDNSGTHRCAVELGDDGRLRRGPPLDGFHSCGPMELDDGSMVLWRAGKLLRIGPSLEVVEHCHYGDSEAAAGRISTNGRGDFAFPLSREAYGRGDWPLHIVHTSLRGVAQGPWPCEGGGSENRCVLGDS